MDDKKVKKARKKSHRRIGYRRKKHYTQVKVDDSSSYSDLSSLDLECLAELDLDDIDVMADDIVNEIATDSMYSVTPSEFSSTTEATSEASQFETSEGTESTARSSQFEESDAGLHSKQIPTSSIFTTTSTKRRRKLTIRPPKSKVVLPSEDKNHPESFVSLEHTQPSTSTDTADASVHTISPHDTVEVKASNDDKLQLIIDGLNLPKKFMAAKDESSLKIFQLYKSHNTAVEKSIYFDNGITRIYAHHLLVPRSHEVYSKVSRPQSMTAENISSYLSDLAAELDHLKICRGIHHYQFLWGNKGHVSDSLFNQSKEPCFRNLHCSVLVSERNSRCHECQAQVRSFKKQLVRLEERQSKDKTKIPHKFLDKSEAQTEMKSLTQAKKREKKKSKRLLSRLNKLKEDSVKVDDKLSSDFYEILENNSHKMSELQKVFWNSQASALKLQNKKNMRWHPMMIRIALKLQQEMTKEGYNEIREYISLPSRRRLYDYSHVIEAKEGCQEDIIKDIKSKIDQAGSAEHFRYVNLMFDEMHIRSGVVVRRSTGEIVGYTSLSDVERELENLTSSLAAKKQTPSLAKKILVYLATGITSDVHDVVAIYSTNELSSSQLFTRTWEVIYNLEDNDVYVLTLTCDGAAVNRKFILMHKPLHDNLIPFATKNLAAGGERPVFFILDPPHLMKTTRNCLANSSSHQNTRKLWKNGECLSWKAIQELYAITSSMKFKGHKLSKGHIKLTSFSRMKVSFATQVFSASVANSLKRFQYHESLKKHDLNELIKFIELMNKFFDCLNGKESSSGESENLPEAKRAYRDIDDERFSFLTGEFLQFFKDWSNDVNRRPGFTKKEKSTMTISHQTLQAINITVLSFVEAVKFMLRKGAPAVNARIFNQDALEQYFSCLRRRRGDDNNPSLEECLNMRVNLHTQGNVAVGAGKGNTEVKRRELNVDPTPLPALKRQRK